MELGWSASTGRPDGMPPVNVMQLFDADAAADAGLPVTKLDPRSEQWQLIWRLWMKYVALGNVSVYEGARASQIWHRAVPDESE